MTAKITQIEHGRVERAIRDGNLVYLGVGTDDQVVRP